MHFLCLFYSLFNLYSGVEPDPPAGWNVRSLNQGARAPAEAQIISDEEQNGDASNNNLQGPAENPEHAPQGNDKILIYDKILIHDYMSNY